MVYNSNAFNAMNLQLQVFNYRTGSVLEMIRFGISLSSEESISDDNRALWRASKSSLYEMRVECVLKMALFKVRSACDILKLSSMWKT